MVDLVFAREQQSYDYLIDLGVSASKCRIAPDFTNLMHFDHDTEGGDRVNPSTADAAQPYACVVPNYRMVDMTEDGVEDAYIEFLCDAVQTITAAGLDARVLLHTCNPNDKSLGDTVCRRTDASLFAPEDALDVKRMIGASECVVSSRFHGLVNALSQNVPAAATGWSHKYQYLMSEYDCVDFLISMEASASDQQAQLANLISDREALRDRIMEAGKAQRQRTEAMWEQVHKQALALA
jgi:colanic acid/amylovoran biosynthesis protein